MSTKPLSRIKKPDLYWVDASGAKRKGNCSNLSEAAWSATVQDEIRRQLFAIAAELEGISG